MPSTLSIINKLQIQFSGKCYQTGLAVDQAKFIDGINLALRKVGWSLTAASYATQTFYFITGAPHVVGSPVFPKIVVGCGGPFLSIGLTNFKLYNPLTEVPNPTAPCVFVAMGTTVQATLANLALAITGATLFNASLVLNGGYYQIVITGKFAGPDLNWVPVRVDGAFAVAGGGKTVGGGYTLTSVGDGHTSSYSVTLSGIANFETDGNSAVQFAFNLNGQGGPAYVIDMVAAIPPPITSFTIVCNPYSFAVFDTSDDQSFPFGLRQTSIAAFAPYQPIEEGFQACYAVFIVGPHNLRTGTIWGFGPNNWKGPITTCLDSLPATYTNFPACPRCLSFRDPGPQALLTPDGQPLITTAWIMMGGDPWTGKNATPAIVGRLWDCAILSDVNTSGLNINGQNFTSLGWQDGSNGLTRSTLLMCNGTAPPPPVTPPPTGPPAGTSLGLVNVSGTSVTWVRGETFNPRGIGLLIYLGADSEGPYRVEDVSPDGHNVVISPAATITGIVPWHT